MVPKCNLTSGYAAFSAGVMIGLLHYCSVWLLLKNKFKIANYEQTT